MQAASGESDPSGLVAGSLSGSVVSVYVLIEQNQITPMLVFLKPGDNAVNRPSPPGKILVGHDDHAISIDRDDDLKVILCDVLSRYQ
jgi:hypothetical protein